MVQHRADRIPPPLTGELEAHPDEPRPPATPAPRPRDSLPGVPLERHEQPERQAEPGVVVQHMADATAVRALAGLHGLPSCEGVVMRHAPSFTAIQAESGLSEVRGGVKSARCRRRRKISRATLTERGVRRREGAAGCPQDGTPGGTGGEAGTPREKTAPRRAVENWLRASRWKPDRLLEPDRSVA